MLPDSKETECGSIDQEAFFISRFYNCFQWCGYFWGPRVSFVMTDESQWGSQKLLQGLMSHEILTYISVFNLFLTQWIMAILSKGCKPGNFEPHNSLKLSFTNISGFHSSFVKCESFLESNSLDILVLCEINLDDSINSAHFSVRGYLPIIWKDSITYMHGVTIYVKYGLAFAWDLSLKNYEDSYLYFDCLYFTQCLLFPLLITFFVFMHSFWF